MTNCGLLLFIYYLLHLCFRAYIFAVQKNKSEDPMKKLSLALSLLAVLGAASCKKDDDKGASDASSAGNWKLGATTYNANNGVKVGSMYSIMDKAGNAVSFHFRDEPKSSGKYRITGAGAVEANDIIVQCVTQSGSADTYNYTSDSYGPTTYADVTVADGKVTIDIAPNWLSTPINNRADSLEFSCHAAIK
jgi:hypothetical protein